MIQEVDINSEVLSVLMCLGNEYVNKIPKHVIQYLLLNSNLKKLPPIDPNKRIEEQNISKDARAFLVMLKLKYWCENEKEKDELINILNKNEKEYQKELNEKYNINNIFEDSKEVSSENIKLIEKPKETLLKKILNKIKKIFK